jgi:hypothetical protein
MPKAAQKIQHKVHSTQNAAPDFLIENHGSLFFLRPLSQSAREWIEENISQTDSFQPHWPTILIEHRYISDIIRGLVEEGWMIR